MTISENLDTVFNFYTQPGVMSDAGVFTPLLRSLPGDVGALVETLQGLMLHVFWSESYGVKLSEERKAEVQIRPVRRKLERLLEIDSRPLSEARPPELRLVGNCRDFSLMLAAMLQARGIPARARCGFGTYFIPGHFEDHWMTEYWHTAEMRWVRVDAQLDELQRKALNIQFDPLDMPEGQFVTGGLAWQMCREGRANPDDFGIFDYKGWDFVKGDLLHDLRALNKVEVLPWDAWGLTLVPTTKLTPEQFALLDHAAALTLADNRSFGALRSLYQQNKGFQVPAEWAD